MHIPHVAGIDHSYKKINKIPAKCLVCGEFSECQILKYEEGIHIFFFTVKVLKEAFLFDWAKCNHRAVLYEKADIARYKLDHIETDTRSVPYYHDMKIQTMTIPKSVRAAQIVFWILLGIIVFVVLLKLLLDYLGIPFFPGP
jgi:hypothetical protein